MGWVAEGLYSSIDTALGDSAELRLDRDAETRAFAFVSGDVYLPSGAVRSFVGERGSFTASEAGVIEGTVTLYTTGESVPPGSRLRISPSTDAEEIELSIDFGEGTVAGRFRRTEAPSRRIKLKIDRLEHAPTPPASIFGAAAGGGRTLVSCLEAAGISAEIGEIGVVPDDKNVPSRTAGELHAMMEKFGKPPRELARDWWLHLMLARRFNWSNADDVTGVMYDVDATDKTPARQGVAVFLESGGITRFAQGSEEWRREMLFTLVHEIGHGLNLPHSFDNERPKALTWMNYPQRIGEKTFWETFGDSFDASELLYLRHAPCCDIAPGRSAYTVRLSDLMSGGSVANSARLFLAPACDDAEPPNATLSVTFLKDIYAYGEPIFLKVSIRNDGERTIRVPRALDPTDGLISVVVVGPDGARRLFRPPLTLCQKVATRSVRPDKAAEFDGVFMSFDADGALFDRPGKYRVEATFNGLAGRPLTAVSKEMRVLYPTRDEELLAIRLWDDRQLMRAVYYRQPLVARNSWKGLLDAHRRARKAMRPDDTTFDYLTYIGGMGYAERFHPTGPSQGFDTDMRRHDEKLCEAVARRDLPSGAQKRIKGAKRKKARQ